MGSNPKGKEAMTVDANKTVTGERGTQNHSPGPHIIGQQMQDLNMTAPIHSEQTK